MTGVRPPELEAVESRVGELISRLAGDRIRVSRSELIREGWSAQHSPWRNVRRYWLLGGGGWVPETVIAKTVREGQWRSDPARLGRERAALAFLASIGSTAAPRDLAFDPDLGILVVEDLGTGPALEDLLVGADGDAARAGVLAFARGLGRMHAQTAGRSAELHAGAQGIERGEFVDIGSYADCWRQLREVLADRRHLPSCDRAESDVQELLHTLSEPGAFDALSNGDVAPANCRLVGDTVRFVDFESATFRHACLDAVALRFPFPAVGCWSLMPPDLGTAAETAYREEFGRAVPAVLDDAQYACGMAAACAIWVILRAIRLPKLERADEPQPMGFSRRGQLLAALDTAVDAIAESGALPDLGGWLSDLADALAAGWPETSARQAVYPAFAARSSGEATG